MKVSSKFIKEFLAFLKEYKIVGVAMAFVMATASTVVVKSLVDNLIMPVVTPFVPNWREAVLNIGPIALKWGAFMADLINFVILAFVVFMIAKIILKEEQVTKK
ncbi:MAG: MscL family protein [Candidatus Gracilibacteria bacterium]|jgi:large conductance mechanosensitive channel